MSPLSLSLSLSLSLAFAASSRKLQVGNKAKIEKLDFKTSQFDESLKNKINEVIFDG